MWPKLYSNLFYSFTFTDNLCDTSGFFGLRGICWLPCLHFTGLPCDAILLPLGISFRHRFIPDELVLMYRPRLPFDHTYPCY